MTLRRHLSDIFESCKNPHGFPIAFAVNTGTTRNSGVHWQGLYLDHEYGVYFFDSFGREPEECFRKFADLMLVISAYLDMLPASMTATQKIHSKFFNISNLSKAHSARHTGRHCMSYWNFQLQSDEADTCGEYTVLFLYNICRKRYPSTNAYSYWLSDEWFCIQTNIDERTDNDTKSLNIPYAGIDLKKVTKEEHEGLLHNDCHIFNVFYNIFHFRLQKVFDCK